jgi:hypothetical protein
MSISVALAMQHLDRHELHGASAMASSTRHAVQLLRQVQVNQSPFRLAFGGSFCDNDIILGNIPMKNLPILKKRLVTSDSIP